MTFDSIRLSQLSYFIETYRQCSYAKAAKAIPITLQGLLKAIHSLERELGLPLFIAQDNMLTPTPYADALYKYSTECFAGLERLKDEFARIDEGEYEVIRIAAAIGTLGLIGIDFAKRFMADKPNIRVEVTECSDLACDDLLTSGYADIGLVVAPYAPNLCVTGLYETPISCWVPKSHPLTSRDFLNAADFAGQDVGLIDQNCKVNGLFMEALRAAEVDTKSLVTTAELFWLHQYASQGKGLGLSAPHVAKVFEGAGDVVSLPVLDIKWRTGIAYRADEELSPGVKQLIAYIRNLVGTFEV